MSDDRDVINFRFQFNSLTTYIINFLLNNDSYYCVFRCHV